MAPLSRIRPEMMAAVCHPREVRAVLPALNDRTGDDTRRDSAPRGDESQAESGGPVRPAVNPTCHRRPSGG